jgi:ABC-type multidrug transport system fused ATPase/permease subunit
MFGKWTESMVKDKGASDFWGQVTKIVAISLTQVVVGSIRGEFDRRLSQGLMMKVKEQLLTRIMRAPVNLFFDVTPNAVIMNRFNNQVHELNHITQRGLWIVREFCNISLSIFLLCQQNYMLTLALVPFFYQI